MQSSIDILCVDERKLDSSYPDAHFLMNDYQFPPFKRDKNKYGQGKIVFRRQGLITRWLPKFEINMSETICVEVLSWLFLKRNGACSLHIDLLKITTWKPFLRK